VREAPAAIEGDKTLAELVHQYEVYVSPSWPCMMWECTDRKEIVARAKAHAARILQRTMAPAVEPVSAA
jgi:hypothetical protein